MCNRYAHLHKEAQLKRRAEKMCRQKRSFATEEEAFQKGQRIYQCPLCGNWHRSGQQAAFINQTVRKASTIKKTGSLGRKAEWQLSRILNKKY